MATEDYYRDENNVTHLTTRVIVMRETTCITCWRPIQYRPDEPEPAECDQCIFDGKLFYAPFAPVRTSEGIKYVERKFV